MAESPRTFETESEAEKFCREREREDYETLWLVRRTDGERFAAEQIDPIQQSDPGYEGSPERQSGVVRWFSNEQGVGRIWADDGDLYFVIFSGIAGDGYRSLRDGDRVTFVHGTGIGDAWLPVADDVRVDAP
jgi:cold shock protein